MTVDNKLNRRFRKLDLFKKVPQDFSSATNIGGLISLACVGLILYFAFV